MSVLILKYQRASMPGWNEAGSLNLRGLRLISMSCSGVRIPDTSPLPTLKRVLGLESTTLSPSQSLPSHQVCLESKLWNRFKALLYLKPRQIMYSLEILNSTQSTRSCFSLWVITHSSGVSKVCIPPRVSQLRGLSTGLGYAQLT